LSGEASDDSAKELAEVENSALRYEGVSAEDLEEVSFILWQLRSMIHNRESRSVADDILDAMSNRVSGENRGMRGAPFWVLKDARMPAVLVETGFLSNPEEARRLTRKSHQQDLARAIAEGISNHLDERSDS
jgi:N-acetylmuramoyl-L-alanine amidase